LDFPDNVVLSYAYRPNPVWNFEVSLDWTNWDRVNAVGIDNPVLPIELVFNWTSSIYFDLGLSYAPEGGPWTYHAGFVHSEDSMPTEFFQSSVSDDTRNFLSAGIEYSMGSFAVVGVLQHGLSTTRNVVGSPMGQGGFSADGRYTSEFWGGALSLDWSF
jgi:long-subunit fatty acid transport protein